MAELTLTDLVLNRTMSPSIAATLATAAAERRSFLVCAIPRHAGKTTTGDAILAETPEGTTFYDLDEAHGPSLGIPEEADGGYLKMAEIARTQFSAYLWGQPVRQVFAALDRGFRLSTALHAPNVDDAFTQICEGNEVPDEHASKISLALWIATTGDSWENPDRRAVAEVLEIDRVEGGKPVGRLLHRWDEASDTFEDVEAPQIIGSDDGGRAERLAVFEAALAAAD